MAFDCQEIKGLLTYLRWLVGKSTRVKCQHIIT